MIQKIQNDMLTVGINDHGGALWSIVDCDGVERMWQGDPTYWSGRDLLLFPCVARQFTGEYQHEGKFYEMQSHGFAQDIDFQVKRISDSAVRLSTGSTGKTLAMYPFVFGFSVTYSLEGDTLTVAYDVENLGENTMYFGIGGHPGFHAPLEKGLDFTDYYLEFSKAALPTRIGFSETCFLNGKNPEYPMKDGKVIPMSHDMFDADAIVLEHMDTTVTMKSDKSPKSVTVSYPDMRYIGFWHMPKTDAPYVCIEPWASLPARDGIVEELKEHPSLLHLEPGKTYKNTWMITIA